MLFTQNILANDNDIDWQFDVCIIDWQFGHEIGIGKMDVKKEWKIPI